MIKKILDIEIGGVVTVVSKRLELTEIQKGIYFDCQVDHPISYNVSGLISVDGLEEKCFENALNLLIGEQEALRCGLEIVNDLPMIVIHDEIEFVLEKIDLSNKENQDSIITEIASEDISKVFDLTKAPLFRMKLIKTNENNYQILICIHHIIADGLSLEIFKKKLFEYYYKLINGIQISLKEDCGFSKFIEEQNEKISNGGYSKQKEFWINKMKGAEPLSLLADYSARQKGNGIGKEKRFDISPELMKKISKLSMDNEVTTYMFFMSVFGVLMNKYTKSEDIVIAAPFSYRPKLDYEESIGCFVYMLPMRLNVLNDNKFSNIMQIVSKELIQVYKNMGYPNNLIMRDSQLVPIPGSPSIYDVSFVYDVYEDTDEYEIKTEIVDQDIVTFPGDMMVVLNKTPEKDMIKIQYKPGVYTESAIELMGKRFIKLLEIIVGNVEEKIENIELLLENEEEQILYDYNDSSFFEYIPQSIIEIFNKKVKVHPERIALFDGIRSETYDDVDRKSNQLARKLLQYKKIDNECIGVQLDRSIDMVITVLSILKAGLAYVPIDPNFPDIRKGYIFEDAKISTLITTSNLNVDENWDINVVYLDKDNVYSGDDGYLEIKLNPFDLAYIMYTSGSTGKPKGVMIENHSVVNTLLDLERRFPLLENDIFLFKTAFTFDVSVTELFGWFMGEGSLFVLAKGEEKNPQFILDEIKKYNITHVNFVPTMFRLFLELFDLKNNIDKLNPLKWIFVGGEAVTPDIIQKFNSLNTKINLENVYGPTECTIWASHQTLKECTESQNISIGKPLNEIRWYIIGNNNELQPVGIPGELCLSGVGLARGYLNRDDLNKEKFIENPFYNECRDPKYFKTIYRTGDLARWRDDGTIEFLGRIDFQVKVRGVRLELGEIENVMAEYEGIVQSVVVVKSEPGKPAALCAYYLSENEIPTNLIKEHLQKSLPTYMIPSFFVHKKELPQNSSGKINRNVLISDTDYLKNSNDDFIPPETDMEKLIASVWQEILDISNVGLDDIFFEIGGHSLSLIQVHNKLRKKLNIDFSITLLFQLPTIRQLADYFSNQGTKKSLNRDIFFKRDERFVRTDIAIIGIDVNVPGAENINEFWSNIVKGEETVHFYDDEELRNLGVDEDVINAPNYIKAKGRINGIETFDARFFEYTPAEVKIMSPQMRILYKSTWKALEDSGYYPGSDSSKIGVFIGSSDDFEWYRKVLMGNESGFSDTYQAFTLSTNHFLATRLSFKFDMKGPAYSALTGCSTTLVTPHLACQSLMLGECDLAIAGGITVEMPNEGGYFFEDGMFFSPDGHCRPFDEKAKGTVFSNGLGLVVLKRLDEAIKDGDNIYAVIKGSAINNDGKQKVGFVAPSVDGQAEVIQAAYKNASIDPETVSYIEAHGTGTSMGDPIEVESLTKAFSSEKKQFCTLGSVKGNIGHADTAAGIVGLAKVALSLKNKFIPGTKNYEAPNPKINFKNTPFKVTSDGQVWNKNKVGGILRAGINSFGVGGTNAHMVLEEAPITKESSNPDKINLLTFSAKSVSALNATSNKVLEYLLNNKGINISDAAWTLQVGRKSFPYRKSIALNENFYNDKEKVLKILNDTQVSGMNQGKKNIYFMFSGQGSQYQGIGRDLYLTSENSELSRIFKKHIDNVFDLLDKDDRDEYKQLMYGTENPQKINQTKYTQFVLFSTSYALAKTMIEIGVKPKGMLGHSIGELVAATIAGVFELKDAVEIIRTRGSLMQSQESGKMMAIMDSADKIKPLLEEGIWLSLENTSNGCVVGGSEKSIIKFEEKLTKLGIRAVRVNTSHAFHTPMMSDAAIKFKAVLTNYKLNEPQIPIVSNVSGEWVKEGEMTNPEYWSKHILNTVNFTKSLTEVLKSSNDVFIELGAGQTLCTFAKQHKSMVEGQSFINMLRHPKETSNDIEYLYNKVGLVWSSGVEIDWNLLKGENIRKRVSLPTYEFDKINFPIKMKIGSRKDSNDNDSNDETYEYEEEVSSKIAIKSIEDVENIVVEAYKDIFGFDKISMDQDFFTIGGDSLKAVSLSGIIKSSVGIKVDVVDMFKYSNPKSLSDYIFKNVDIQNDSNKIKPAKKMEYYPLSSAQNRMYALYLLEKDNVAYNLPSATLIKGNIDKARLEKALRKLVDRHEALRTSFDLRDGKPVQIIKPSKDIEIKYSEKKVNSKEEIDELIHNFIKPFDLEKGYLFRVELVKTAEERYILLFDVHHIISDGTSMEIVTKDFNGLYFGEVDKIKLQYKDFAVWQKEYIESDEIKIQKNYWSEKLIGELPVLNLPTDFERPKVKDFDGSRVYFKMDKSLSEKISKLALDSGSTMFMTLLSAWNILLARYSNQEDIIVGSPVAGRNYEGIEETVGMFVNMLPMRNLPNINKKYSDFLSEVKENALGAFKNGDYQFDMLVEDLNIKRELNRNAIFDVCFDFQNMKLYDLEIEGIKFTPHEFETKTAAYDLILTCQDNKTEGQIEGFIEFSTALYKRETIEKMIEHLKVILSKITSNKEIKIGEIDIVTDDESKIINTLNDTIFNIDYSKTTIELFEENVQFSPDKIALIVSGGKSFSYSELDKKANKLANYLINLGVEKGSLVGIMTKRDESMFISLLAVLKAGGAYVPIDPGFPKDRIDYMLNECNAKILITPSNDNINFDFKGTIIDSNRIETYGNNEDKLNVQKCKNDLACVIFTSGSTGRPKGVMINQKSIINFINDIKNRKIFSDDSDRVICVTTLSFDIFGFESIVPLCIGNSIYLANELEQLDPQLVNDSILEYKVTHILSTVSRIKAFVENLSFEKSLKQLKCILSGGENYPIQMLKDIQKKSKAKIFNMYGPTETTIWSTTKELTSSNTINIGKPIVNTKVYILNSCGKIQPIGVFGELCIAGDGLARGYLNNDEETKKKFIKVSDLGDELIYKTGDKARITDNGEIEIMGRLDSQIKIRGYRIEVDEIEKVVLKNEMISNAVVNVFEDNQNNKHLSLYYTLKDSHKNLEDVNFIKDWLKDKLPHYMIPSYFVKLDTMPTLPNGKINRKNLPEIDSKKDIRKIEKIKTTSIQCKLLDIWKEVLSTTEIGVKDNFFDVGGNSLGLILVNNKINQLLGITIPLVQLFQYPTIDSLIKYLKLDEKIEEEVEKYEEVQVENNNEKSNDEEYLNKDIAIIGIGCRFPGAMNSDEYWNNIRNGIESVTEFSDEELLASGIDLKLIKNPNYVKNKAYLDGVEYFDSDFFDYPYQEANMMDPQIRLLHQCVWEALENAGYNSFDYEGKIGLFAGSGNNLAWTANFFKDNNLLNAFEALTLNEKDFLTTRVSYKLNLKGPSFNVQTACSTSLVAIHQAIMSIKNGESDMALAGGVSISYPRKEGYLWHEGMIFSKDGHCRPFSDDSSGTISGNGCGIILLKSLETAKRDGDNIYAVIKGSSINNDGIDKIGYTAPSVNGQCDVIEKALKISNIDPETITYLETHGTGTKLGDPIEVEALKQAYNTNKTNYCALGSVKANIGHLDSAAGVAGFIKAALVLYNREIPPMVNFNKPNPALNIDKSPFYIPTKATKILDNEKLLRAGVSSFGIGGTNVHVVLEQPPIIKNNNNDDDTNLLIFSARSNTALNNTMGNIIDFVKDKNVNLSNASWTLKNGRRHFEYRKAITVGKAITKEDIDNIKKLLSVDTEKVTESKNKVKIVLTGDKSRVPNIGVEVYNGKSEFSKLFRNQIDSLISEMRLEDAEIMNEIFSKSSDIKEQKLKNINLVTFVTEYAIVKALLDLNIRIDKIYGYALGEISAKMVSDIIDFDNAVEIVKYYKANVDLSKFKVKNTSIQYDDSFNSDDIIISIFEDTKFTGSKKLVLINKLDKTFEYNFSQLLGQLWCCGIDLDWNVIDAKKNVKKIPLPTYVFDKKYHNNDIVLSEIFSTSNKTEDKDKSNLNTRTKEGVADILKGLWKEVLGSSEINEEDDFFDIGGHSLKAISLSAQIQQVFEIELSLSKIFDNSKFSQMLELLLDADIENKSLIEPVEKREYYEVSSAQKRMYAVSEFLDGEIPYNLTSAYMIDGEIDKDKFKKVIDKLVDRHESFRTRFEMIDGEVYQKIEEKVQSVVSFGTIQEKDLEKNIQKYFSPFDLSKAPLLRVYLLEINKFKHVLLIDIHHIITDQYSIAILLNEIKELYFNKDLKELKVQYKDFAYWQNEYFKSEEFNKQLEFWKKEFSGEIPVLNLFTDFSRPAVQSYEGDSISFEFCEELSRKIEEYSKQLGITPYMFFLTALKIVLWKSTGQNDLVVGTGIVGRKHADLEDIVGMFVNTLAIRSKIDEKMTVEEYLKYIKNKLINAYENQDCQFEMLVEELNLEKDLSRNPLFDIVINYINMGTDELRIDGLNLSPITNSKIDSKFDFTWTIIKKGELFTADIEYSIALFKKDNIVSIKNRLLQVIDSLILSKDRKISEIDIVSNYDKKLICNDLNDTLTNYPSKNTIVELFEEVVKSYPNNIAIEWANEKISYRELNKKVNGYANRLTTLGVLSGDKVGILLERSPIQIVSILAILKVGGIYVPIDPEYPESRIAFMLEDSDVSLVLTNTELSSLIGNNISYIDIDKEESILESDSSVISVNKNSEDIVYIMYTSGSTGKPKGTLIKNKNVIRVVKNTNYIEISPNDKILQLSNYAFDGSVFDIFGSLLNGATLVMVSKEIAIEIPQLSEFIEDKKISVFFITTALFNMLIDWDMSKLKNVRKILFGGEATSIPHARKALNYLGKDKVVNVYGPTETTVFATYYPINEIKSDDNFIPIGKAISNTKLYIVDKEGNVVPPYVPGELFIGGDGVANGYLNRKELTSEKFIKDKFNNEGKLYRTGDLVCYNKNYEILFLGRLDFQIKIRGFRVELGEIENHIKRIEGVKEVTVVALKDSIGSMYIAAYYTANENNIGPGEIKESLISIIPDYMVPTRILKMDMLPLNRNGKIDRNALPVIKELRDDLNSYVAPETEIEELILVEMQNVLDNKSFGIKDDFFKFGGQSIKAIALVHALSKQGIKIKVNEIFQNPTVEELVQLPQIKTLNKKSQTIKHQNNIVEIKDELVLNNLDEIVEELNLSNKIIANVIKSTSIKSKFEFSTIQLIHQEIGSNLSGFTTNIIGDIEENSMKEIIASIISENQLLHSIASKEDRMFWNEYDTSLLFNMIKNLIFYKDLRAYNFNDSEKIQEIITYNVLASLYQKNDLPWRIAILKLDNNIHKIVWSFDHTAFDGMSAEVIRIQIESKVNKFIYKDEDIIENKLPQKYSDYVKLLKDGPKNIDEKDIIDTFSLNKWSEMNDEVMNKLNEIEGVDKEIEINIPLNISEIKDPWWNAFSFIDKFLKEYIGVETIPFGIIDYGRSYYGEDYYNCVGEFLDIIPLMLGECNVSISELLSICKTNSLNFISLMYDDVLSKKFYEVNSILKNAYTKSSIKELILFNFQGYVSKDERNDFKNSVEKFEDNKFAKFLITVNYDDENLNINIESKNGMNIEKFESIIKPISKKENVQYSFQ